MFLKIPLDWDSNDNGFMPAFSRLGRAGDAGKTGRNSDPDESICGLFISNNGREPQFNFYPLSQTFPTTCWGQGLPEGQWWHVAVVNDGTTTKMYVDGCEVARNPSTPANGLVTLNLPWMLGGYEYQGTINQVFFGGVGDVRIVDRALPVSQFMIS